jgi:hypothetical protein
MSAVAEAEFTPEQIERKLSEIGLVGRGLLSPAEVCAFFNCSRAHFYRSLAHELQHTAVSEKITGVLARNVALLLLRRERERLPVRRRGRKKV